MVLWKGTTSVVPLGTRKHWALAPEGSSSDPEKSFMRPVVPVSVMGQFEDPLPPFLPRLAAQPHVMLTFAISRHSAGRKWCARGNCQDQQRKTGGIADPVRRRPDSGR